MPIQNASNPEFKTFTSTFLFRVVIDRIISLTPIRIVIKIFKLVGVIRSIHILLASLK